jgi:DNA/RNA endonuclease G (NUC1)
MRLPSLRAVAGLAGTFAFLSCADAPTAPELATPSLAVQAKAVTYPAVLISQIYGGGGNSGATLRNDFIELFNPGTSPVNLTGWRVGYASSAGSTWQYTALSGTIPAGGYYLVQQAQGSGGTVSLPTPDAVGTIAMAAGAGKVIVQNAAIALSGTCPIGGSVVDQVGFGTASNCGAVWGATTATLTNTTAALRQDDGCRYTPPPAAATDFATGAPAPRNSATATIVCEGGEDPGPQPASVTVSPASAALTVGGTVTLTAAALDGDGAPIATSFTWSSNAAAVASVSSSGVVTANAAGSATITATTPNGVSASASITVSAPPRAVSDATIQINELMGDPVNAESASWGEWFEVHNTGSVAVDLNGWTILSGGSGQPAHVIDESVVVPAGGYAVLGRGNDPARNGGLVLDYNYFVGSSSTIWLDNNDYLVLLDGASALVDSLSWTSLPRGATKGLRPGAAPVTNADDAAWGFAITTFGDGDYGTPDAVNAPLGDTPPAVSPNRLSITGRLSSDTLPVGFEDQLFGTLRDPSNTVIPTTITWTSLTPALASVDARGVIRALAVGNAVFRAVAEDGTGRNITIPLKIALPSAVTYADHAEFGEPVDADASDDFLVRRREYTTSWNGGRGIPNWVVYNLTGDHIVSGQDRCDCFTFDPALETAGFARYTTADYTGAGAFLGAGIGVDRGHLARSFDRTAGALDNANTFLFSNIIPQFSDNNQGPWAQHENYLGNLATAENKELFIYAGASGSLGTVKNEGLITIPAWTWKVSVIAPRGTRLEDVRDYRDLEVIAVVMPNTMGIRNANWQTEYVVTADSVERLSGYRFLTALPEKTRRALVTGTKPPLGEITEPVAGLEGAPIAFDASNSVDPNGTVVSYAWDFGDGNTGTGVVASHTYQVFGSYTARLVVVDNDGLADTTYTTVEVAQVTPAQGIAQVQELVQELATLIGLNRGETQAVLAKVNAAAAALDRGNVEAALGQLGALRNQLDALVNSGRATSGGIERITLAIERVERAAN